MEFIVIYSKEDFVETTKNICYLVCLICFLFFSFFRKYNSSHFFIVIFVKGNKEKCYVLPIYLRSNSRRQIASIMKKKKLISREMLFHVWWLNEK